MLYRFFLNMIIYSTSLKLIFIEREGRGNTYLEWRKRQLSREGIGNQSSKDDFFVGETKG